MFRKVKKLLKNSNEKKKDKKSRSTLAPSDDELFIDPKRFVLTERYKILWEYLMNHAPNADGIFRVPGSQPRIRALKLLIDSQNTPDLEQYDVHVVGGVFKQYLREQKEPLLTHDLYEGFIAAHGIEDERKKIDTVKSLLNNLPLGFLTALRALVELLYKIDRNSDVNLMSMTNLAIVFSPTLLRARDETVAKIMQDSTAAHGIVLFLLSQAELLAFFGVKPTEKNEVSMAGEPRSDPTLITSAPRTIETDKRNSRMLAQSSPNLIAPSSSPVLLQLGEHAMTPRERIMTRERTSSSSSNSPTRSPRNSRIKLSSDYLSKDTMNIIAALDMIIEGKDISSSDDDGPATNKSSDGVATTTFTPSNNTNRKPSEITTEEFDISQPLKPKNGEKIEHLDSDSEDSEIDSEEEKIKPKKQTSPPPAPVVSTEPAPRKGLAKIGSNRAVPTQPKKELFEQPLKGSQSMPRISPRKDSSNNVPRSPRKDSAADETKKTSPRKDSAATETKKTSPRNENGTKKESPREMPRSEPNMAQRAEIKEELVVAPPEPVKVKNPTPLSSPRAPEQSRKLPTPPVSPRNEVASAPLSPREAKPATPRKEEVAPLSPRETKPPTPRKEEAAPLSPRKEVAPLSPRETKPPTPRKEEAAPLSPRKEVEVVEEPKAPSPPKVASPVQSPRKVEEEMVRPVEVKQLVEYVEPQVVAPKTPTPLAIVPKQTTVSPRTVVPKTAVPKTGPAKQSPKQVTVSPRKVPVPIPRTQTAPEIPSPRAKVIMPDTNLVNDVPNADFKMHDGVSPVAISPKTPVAHVKLTPLIVSPKTPGQGKTAPIISPKGPQTPHTPTSGRTLASPKKSTAVVVSPRASGELMRTVSVSAISKPTSPIITPDIDGKRASPRSLTTEDVEQKEKHKNDKLRRQHVVDELLNDLDLIEQFTCRMYQDMEVYNKEQTGFVVEIFKDIIKFLTASLKEEKVMITPADIGKFMSASNARFITDIDSGKIAIRDQFKVIMGLSGEIKEKLFAPASSNTDAYFNNLSFMFDQITEFLENVIAEMSDDDDEDEATGGIDPQLLQLKNALDEAIQKLERDIVAKFSERINKAASLYSIPHLTILFDSLVWMKKKMNGFNPPMPDDQAVQQVLRISAANVSGGKLTPDAMTKAHSLIASCNAELKDFTEYQLAKMRTEAATALNNFDASIARYRIINSVKVLNQIAQFVSKFKQVPLQMSDNVVPTATKDESEQLAKETMQQTDRLKLIGTVIKKQLLNINGLEQAIFVSKIIKTIKLFVMSSAEVEVNGQDLIDFATSYDNLSDELRSIVARGLPVTEASPEDVPKVKSLLVAGGVIMEEFIASLPKLKEQLTALKAKPFPHTHIEYASQRVKLIYKLLELIVQVNKSYDGPLSATPRALSMPTVLSPPGSPSLMPTSPRSQHQQPASPRSATGAGTAASNPGLMRSQSTPINDPSVIEEKTIHCRQLLSVVLSKVNSITDINLIVAMGQVGKAIKKVLNDAAKKQPVSFVSLALHLEPSAEALSAEHLEKMNSLKHLIINLLKDVDKELSHISSFGINNTMALSLLNYIQQLLSKLN